MNWAPGPNDIQTSLVVREHRTNHDVPLAAQTKASIGVVVGGDSDEAIVVALHKEPRGVTVAANRAQVLEQVFVTGHDMEVVFGRTVDGYTAQRVAVRVLQKHSCITCVTRDQPLDHVVVRIGQLDSHCARVLDRCVE